MLPFRYLIFALALMATCQLSAQHIFVQSFHQDAGGWIVTPTGETLCELPFGWRPVAISRSTGMAPVDRWPYLVQKVHKNGAIDFALVEENGYWREMSAYTWVKTLGFDLLLTRKGEENRQLEQLDGKILGQGYRTIWPYNQQGIAVAELKKGVDKYYQGLLDTLGNWQVHPTQKKATDLGHGLYRIEDTLGNTYLLTQSETQENRPGQVINWDTLMAVAAGDQRLKNMRAFSENGYTVFSIGPQQFQVMDTSGKTAGAIMDFRNYHNARTFFEQRAVVSGRVQRKNRYGIIDTHGEWITHPRWEHLLDYRNGRALAADTINGRFGYLNQQGNWAIAPQYCYASSFQHGVAIVADFTNKDLCQGKIRRHGGDKYHPTGLKYSGWVRNYQLIDTTEQVVWEGLCQRIYLPSAGVVGMDQSVTTKLPAYRLEWIGTDKYWINPGFVFTKWEQVITAMPDDVVHLDLGTGRPHNPASSLFDLPVNFSNVISSLPALEILNLRYHDPINAWPIILTKNKLTKLNLRNCQLTEIPDEIKDLESLEELYLSNNQLTELPRSIYRMRHLRVLSIADNPLPPSTILRLRKALPDTEIIYK